jgi:uncharacterized damage-inducible protein DinB
MRRAITTAAVILAIGGGTALAQMGGNPATDGSKWTYGMVKGYLIQTAEQVPEADYAFRPTPEVRTLGRILGHVADSNFMMCAAASGMKPPMSDVEKTKTSKADLTAAVKQSFDFCDQAFASMTDAKGAELVKFFGGQRSRLTVLDFNTSHDFEHYGNLVTYMRLKGMVPPSSQRGQ